MNWKLFATAFSVVFVAELGDKTQIATFGLAASQEGGRLSVFAGSALALIATSLIAVVAGAAIGKAVPPVWLERAGGVLFLVLGAWTLWNAR
jgi:putative Ca2+/H+ antiporter (TMEM165/GDT1 family)